tara:strand:- start:188 stop:547 length:360 start_codon:yes stop_codon:yes gene_type:complete
MNTFFADGIPTTETLKSLVIKILQKSLPGDRRQPNQRISIKKLWIKNVQKKCEKELDLEPKSLKPFREFIKQEIKTFLKNQIKYQEEESKYFTSDDEYEYDLPNPRVRLPSCIIWLDHD